MLKVIRKYAVWFATGGAAALEAMNSKKIVLPVIFRTYLIYVLSTITIICIFLAGISIVEIAKNAVNIFKKITNEEEDEKEKKI